MPTSAQTPSSTSPAPLPPQLDRDAVESAYCFFHQKWQVYHRSTLGWQRDDIEYAIAQYADAMDRPLYALLADGRADFLLSHASFAADLSGAVARLETLVEQAAE